MRKWIISDPSHLFGVLVLYALSIGILGFPLFFHVDSEAVDSCWAYTTVFYGTNCPYGGSCAYSYGGASPHKVCTTNTSIGYFSCENRIDNVTVSSDIYNYMNTCVTKPCMSPIFTYCQALSFRKADPNTQFLFPCKAVLTTGGCSGD